MRWREVLKLSILAAIIFFSSFQKYKVFDESGGDFEAYRGATREFLSGKNPYNYTVKSFTEKYDKFGEELRHGYAYLPGLMYVQAPLYLLQEPTHMPLQRLWRFPLLGADIGVSVLIAAYLYRKNFLAALAGVAVWSYHPFFFTIGSYTNWEPYPVFFALLALHFLEKRDDLSAFLFAIAVVFKTFPIILLPIFLLKSKNRTRFLLIGALVFLAISLPFMGSFEDFETYIRGSLLVHGERELQGRPLLSYVDYYTTISFHQVSLVKIYTYVSLLGSWAVTWWLFAKKKIQDKFILAAAAFLTFYIFTPVLNRTYLIWWIPFMVLAAFNAIKKRPWLYFAVLALFYVFYSWYLSQWTRGFRFEGDIISL